MSYAMTGAPPMTTDCNRSVPGAPVIGISDWLGRWSNFTNTETSRPITLPSVDEADESPKGLGLGTEISH